MIREYRFCCIFFIYLFDGSNGAPSETGQNTTDLATDLENWMSLLPHELRTVPLNFLAIPGSHDSFTSDISSRSKVSPDGESILKELESLSIVKVVMANWSKTQAYNVLQQLQAGIRYFDLRICNNNTDGNLYFCHAMYSTRVATVLGDMRAFLDNHPDEVVILDCQHFYNFTGETHREFIRFLKDTFGNKLIPDESTMSPLSLENLSVQKQQVLIVYRDSNQSQQPLLWSTKSYPTPWYDTMNTSHLISSLTNGLKSRPAADGYVSQLILTPDVKDIIGNILSTLRQKCAVDFLAERTQWISNQIPGQGGVNVIIADFVDLSNDSFSKTIINLNLKLDVAQINSVSIFDKVKNFFSNIKDFIF